MFTNSEFSLKYIDVYGFDFDYTLAHYSKDLHRFIYQQARDVLIKKLNVSSCYQTGDMFSLMADNLYSVSIQDEGSRV